MIKPFFKSVSSMSSIVFSFFASLLFQLRSCRLPDLEERLKEFAIKLSLLPIPPPGHLHLVCSSNIIGPVLEGVCLAKFSFKVVILITINNYCNSSVMLNLSVDKTERRA